MKIKIWSDDDTWGADIADIKVQQRNQITVISHICLY